MALLDDILASYNALPPEERVQALDAVTKVKAAEKWCPQPGPQTEAYFSPADVLLYGGSAGSGKSDLGIGLAYTAHDRSMILRRRYTDLGAITDRMIEIHGSKDGYNGSSPPSLKFQRGGRQRLITFSAAQHLGDEMSSQGQPYDFKCVGGSTKVLLADGDCKPIRDVTVGMMVATLEGPKRVSRVWPVRRGPAVRVVASDVRGSFVCSQDQSLTHEVLTPEGWVSLGKSGATSQLLICEPTESDGRRRPSKSSVHPSLELAPHRQDRLNYLQRLYARARDRLALAGSTAHASFLGRLQRGIAAAMSYASPLGGPLPAGSFSLSGHQSPHHASNIHSGHPSTFSFRNGGDQPCSRPPNWKGHYSSAHHRDGERAPSAEDRLPGKVGGLFYPLQPVDAGRPSPNDFAADGQERIPTRSHRTNTYPHPYTKEIRSVREGDRLSALTFHVSPIGEIDLYDLEVEEVNHYITESGIINRNCFDEAVHFLEQQVRFHLGWLRSTVPGQRCRAVLGTNPPINSDGDWIIGMFRPWLDLTHPRPAEPGELRWFVTAPDGSDLEVDDATPVQMGAKTLIPQSRSFIPSKLQDNIYLVKTDYQARLDALPEPIRSAVRDGNFMATRTDAERQIIPTQWIVEAQARWTAAPPETMAQVAIAADIAQGGEDRTVISSRRGGWFAEQIVKPGKETPDGASVAALIIANRRDGSAIILDMGGGYGGATKEKFDENAIPVVQFNGAHASSKRTRDGSLNFYNRRAEAWWTMREELDPEQEGGSPICLPPDPELRSQLAAPSYEVTPRGIKVEVKEDVKKRLGCSPDKADAAVMCLAEGKRTEIRQKRRSASRNGPNGLQTKSNVGYAHLKEFY